MAQKITPYLWFNDQAEEAAEFYTSLFANSRVVDTARYGGSGPDQAGTVMLVTFELDGQRFYALNGGPQFRFTEAVSLYVECEDQAEVDRLWEALTRDGEPSQCGWLKDRYGLSWQIIPKALPELLGDPDPARSARVMKAMLAMSKIDIQALRDA